MSGFPVVPVQRRLFSIRVVVRPAAKAAIVALKVWAKQAALL
jgi:hypothetical protein